MNITEASEHLAKVAYRDWIISVKRGTHGGMYLQANWNDERGKPQSSRKWTVSARMTKSELIQTALKCVLTAEEHEARENFKYAGKRTFGPHFDVDVLHAVCDGAHLDLQK